MCEKLASRYGVGGNKYTLQEKGHCCELLTEQLQRWGSKGGIGSAGQTVRERWW